MLVTSAHTKRLVEQRNLVTARLQESIKADYEAHKAQILYNRKIVARQQ